MANQLKNRLDDLKSSIERLSPRERRLVGGLGITFIVVIVAIVGLLIQSGLDEIEERNAAIHKALRDIEKHREAYSAQRRRIAALESRMKRAPLELNRFVETNASAVGVSIAESGEIAPVKGKKYTQRGVEIKLRKVKIEELAKLLKELENSPHIVQITRLSVNSRWGQHEELDVEMIISTYEHSAKKKSKGKKKGTKSGARSKRNLS